jgi:hypothetical protein
MLVPAATPFLYHWYTGAAPPFTAEAVKVTLVPVHTGLAVLAVMLTDGVIKAVTAKYKILLFAVVAARQAALLVTTHHALSPLLKAPAAYVLLLVPTATLSLYHWYTGVVPPFTAVAVKVTLVPAQTGLAALAVTATEGVTSGLTV